MKIRLRLQPAMLLVASVLCLPLASAANAETYSYDAAGRLSAVVYDEDNSISYNYDSSGNLLELVSSDDPLLPNEAPSVLIAGGSRTVFDTDAYAGEVVSFAATATDSDGTVTATEWLINSAVVATGPTVDIALPDGQSIITFKATDNDGDSSTDTVTIIVGAPPLEEGWPVPYSGVTPPESLGLSFNNISAFNGQDGLIYSCLRILVDDEQSNLDGIEEFDIAFEIVSLDPVEIGLVKIKPFNGTGALNENGEMPDCSGAIELTTGVYTDILLVGSDVFGIEFVLSDPVNLIFQLVGLSFIGSIP